MEEAQINEVTLKRDETSLFQVFDQIKKENWYTHTDFIMKNCYIIVFTSINAW